MISKSISRVIPLMNAYLSSQPAVKKVWIFGSCARGEETLDSDVDFLVDYDRSQKLTLFTIGGIISNLEKLFGRRVDFVENGYLQPYATASADQDKILVYERANS